MNYLERRIYDLPGMDSTQRHLGEARLCLHKQNHVGELMGSFRASPLLLVAEERTFCCCCSELLRLALHKDQTHQLSSWLVNLHNLKEMTEVMENVGNQGVDQTSHR